MQENKQIHGPNGLIKMLRSGKESAYHEIISLKNRVNDGELLELVKILDDLYHEYDAWVGMAVKQVAQPEPAFHNYYANCVMQASIMLEAIDKVSEVIRQELAVKKKLNQEKNKK